MALMAQNNISIPSLWQGAASYVLPQPPAGMQSRTPDVNTTSLLLLEHLTAKHSCSQESFVSINVCKKLEERRTAYTCLQQMLHPAITPSHHK